MQPLMIIGVYLWGALYTAGVFVAALSLGNHTAMFLALLSAGSAYLAQFSAALAYDQTPLHGAWQINAGATVISICSGVAAGFALLIGG